MNGSVKRLRRDIASRAVIAHYPLEEHTPIRGNASASGNDDTDSAIERSIEQDLRNGNSWAWCTVMTTATYHGTTASAYLGCCSFASEEEFLASDCCAAQVDDAVDCLVDALSRPHVEVAS